MTGKKFDNGKLPMSLLPFASLEEVTKVLDYGAVKYAPDNWQFVPNAVRRYEDALLRHFSAYKKGETHDKESGLTHLSHMACNALFLVWFELQKTKEEECELSTQNYLSQTIKKTRITMKNLLNVKSLWYVIGLILFCLTAYLLSVNFIYR